MRYFLTIMSAVLAVACAAPAMAATTAPGSAFDKIIVFGDSLSDIGNIYAVTSALGVPTPGAPYYKGRYSNGQLWVEHVAGIYGITLKPSLDGGTDWAFAGAETTTDRSIPIAGNISAKIPSLKTQVTSYLLTVLGRADPKALYVIWGGANDIFDTTSPSTLPSSFASATVGLVKLLKSAGAKNFLIPNIPDLGVTPEAAEAGDAAAETALTEALNAALTNALASSSLKSGITIYRLPVFRSIDVLVESATHFNFTNVVDPCISGVGSTVCANPDHTLFWDDFHPTSFGHAMLAIQAEALLPLD
jgi:outer membrane lipase/esterase